MVEQLEYRVVRPLSRGAELRYYPAHWLASVDVAAGIEQAGSIGFRPLVGFISGQNNRGQRIAMTAPVIQQESSGGQSVSFVLPRGVDTSQIPLPSDSRIVIEEKAPGFYAALQFRGGWQAERVLGESARLTDVIEQEGLTILGPPLFARFNPPSVPGVFRRNEVMIPVADPDALSTNEAG